METEAPKMMYVTRDGQKYGGDTAYQVVDAMRADSSFTNEKDLALYMKGAAARYKKYDEIVVRTDTPEHFIADLVKGGALKKV